MSVTAISRKGSHITPEDLSRVESNHLRLAMKGGRGSPLLLPPSDRKKAQPLPFDGRGNLTKNLKVKPLKTILVKRTNHGLSLLCAI